MNIKIWDNHNKQWLEPITIYFGTDNTIWRVTACKIDEDPLINGWYDLQGDDLLQIVITGDLNWNTELLQEDLNLTENEKKILNLAVSAIYFNDKSDYLRTLYSIVNTLIGDKQNLNIDELFNNLNKQ